MDHQNHHQRGSTALRLTFTTDETGLKLVDSRRIRMRVPAGERVDERGETDGRVGSWVEVRDAEDEVLYRRRTRPIARETVEVPRVGGGFDRVPTPMPRVVSVLVPDVEGARRVLLRERRSPRETHSKPTEIDHASVSLEEVDAHDDHDGDGHDGNDHNDGGSRTAGGC
jgi:hypothetical protein